MALAVVVPVPVAVAMPMPLAVPLAAFLQSEILGFIAVICCLAILTTLLKSNHGVVEPFTF